MIWRQDPEARFREHLVKHLERRLVEPRGTVDRVTDNHPASENVLAQSVDLCRREFHLTDAAQQERRHQGRVVAELGEPRLGGHVFKVLGARRLMELQHIIGGDIPILGQLLANDRTTAPLHFRQQVIRRRRLLPIGLRNWHPRHRGDDIAFLTTRDSHLELLFPVLGRLHEPVIGRGAFASLPGRAGSHRQRHRH